MKKTPSICIINVYFGKFPAYFALWIKSCQYNHTIDFLVITDQSCPLHLPRNVHFLPYTLQQMQQKASQILGFEATLNRPYKCCDYKAMYGLLFQEYIKRYDYWGHCDIDLVFGDIRSFVQKYNLEAYDKFFPLGHLSLFKNTNAVNHAYQLPGSRYSYRYVFTTAKSCYFDEDDGIMNIFLVNRFPFFTKRVFADISYFFHRFIEAPHKFANEPLPRNYKYQTYYWKNGKVFRAYIQQGVIYTQEYAYIHLQKRPNFPVTFDINTVSAYYITPSGFIPKDGPVTINSIKCTNPFMWREHLKDTFFYKRKRFHYYLGRTKLGKYLLTLKRK